MPKTVKRDEKVNKGSVGRVHKLKQVIKHGFWRHLGSGSFNDVYVHHESDTKLLPYSDYKGPWVYKKKKQFGSDEDKMNSPARNARIFKEIHPDKPVGLFRNGWLGPFVKGNKPTDQELVDGILDVYRRTRRIVVDAFSNNFITANGNAQCIDVDMALRRNSIDSREYWNDGGLDTYEPYWDQFEDRFPLAVNIVRNLVYLEENLGARSILDVHITDNIISALTFYRLRHLKITSAQLDAFRYMDKDGRSIREEFIKPLEKEHPLPKKQVTPRPHKLNESDAADDLSVAVEPISPEDVNEALHELVYNDDEEEDYEDNAFGLCNLM